MIWEGGSLIDDEYSRSGRTRVVEAVVLMFMVHEWRLHLMNARVQFACRGSNLMYICLFQFRSLVMHTPR